MEQEERATMMLRNIVEMGKFSLELEDKREQSIITQAGQMLTSFSIITAVILMLIPIVFEATTYSKFHVFVALAIISIPLLISFVAALTAQWRFKYESMQNIEEIYNAVFQDHESYPDENSFRMQWIEQIKNVSKSKSKINDRRVALVMVSMWAFFVAIILSIILAAVIIF